MDTENRLIGSQGLGEGWQNGKRKKKKGTEFSEQDKIIKVTSNAVRGRRKLWTH